MGQEKIWLFLLGTMLWCGLAMGQNAGTMKVVLPTDWQTDSTVYTDNRCWGRIIDSTAWEKRKYYILSDYQMEQEGIYFPCAGNRKTGNYMLYLAYRDSAGNRVNTRIPGLAYSLKEGKLHGKCVFYTREHVEAIFYLTEGIVTKAEHYREGRLYFSFHYSLAGNLERYVHYWKNTEVRWELYYHTDKNGSIRPYLAKEYDRYGSPLFDFDCRSNTMYQYNWDGTLFGQKPLPSCDFTTFFAIDLNNRYIIPLLSGSVAFINRNP